jgi:hypothetical protein
MSNSGFLSIESVLLGLLRALPSEWTSAEREEVKHFIDVGEWGLALETIAGITMDENRTLPDCVLAEMELLAIRMGIASDEVMSELRRHMARR